MDTVTIYHNPACGTSRNVLALLREAGQEPRVVEYLKTPLSREQLRALAAGLGTGVRGLVREKEKLYAELDLGNARWSDEQLLDFMVEHPVLMNRPVVVTAKGTRLCRPADMVRELL